jgi:hypothetical protein
LPGILSPGFRIPLELTRHQKKRKVDDDKDPRSDDCLIPGADSMSSIQPSATTKLPSTPHNILANADRDPPMFDQTTIESSSVALPIVTIAPHDIEPSEDLAGELCAGLDWEFFSKRIISITY